MYEEDVEQDVMDTVCAWFDQVPQQRATKKRIQKLQDLNECLVSWLAPRTKEGRVRSAPDVIALSVVVQSCLLLYATYVGKKRPVDQVWTRGAGAPLGAGAESERRDGNIITLLYP